MIRRLFLPTAALALTAGRLFGQHDMHAMNAQPGLVAARQGSGTSWIPEASAHPALSRMAGAWTLSLHGAAFAFYSDQGTKRGATQAGLVDWEMGMAQRPFAGGTLTLRAMTSLEPFTMPGDGYPLLLQNGGSYRHAPIQDRQHPHNAIVEVAAMQERALGPAVVSLYAAAAGEPALGPVTYLHRPSAAGDPFSPLGHHWQDATHEAYGVVTAGVGTRTLRLEGSAFNARETDEHAHIVDYRGARLDSYAGRVSWAISPRVVASAWMGYLNQAERLDPGTRIHRYGASLLTEMRGFGGGRWSSALVWGENRHDDAADSHELAEGGPGAAPHRAAQSLLVESSLDVGPGTTVFARAERVEKNGEEMGFSGGDLTTLYDIRVLTVGATHRLLARAGADLSIGARASFNSVPASLLATYGTRSPTGAAVYLRLTPAAR